MIRDEVLDEILKVLISIDRKDLVDAYMGIQYSRPRTQEKKVKAKKKWKCIKCKDAIDIGEYYVCITHVDNKYVLTERYCLECKEQKEETKKLKSKQNQKIKFLQNG